MPTSLKGQQEQSIKLPLNPPTPYYCHYHNSHLYIASFSNCHQKHKHCRDQQRLCAPDLIVFVKLKHQPAHLCNNKPAEENYMLLTIFRTEDFLKSCMQQHFFVYQHILGLVASQCCDLGMYPFPALCRKPCNRLSGNGK